MSPKEIVALTALKTQSLIRSTSFVCIISTRVGFRRGRTVLKVMPINMPPDPRVLLHAKGMTIPGMIAQRKAVLVMVQTNVTLRQLRPNQGKAKAAAAQPKSKSAAVAVRVTSETQRGQAKNQPAKDKRKRSHQGREFA